MVRATLEERGLAHWLTDRERRSITESSDEHELVQMSWRVEALAALGWSLALGAQSSNPVPFHLD